MQKEYKLYNFDHGLQRAKRISIEAYSIEITDEHITNLDKLEQNAKRVFTVNDDLQRIIKKTDFQKGISACTAILKVDENSITPSIIYTDLPEKTSIDDFVILLSFLTGRQVYLEDDLNGNIVTAYHDGAVNNNFFYSPIIDIEEGFNKLRDLKLETQFYNLTFINAIRDLPSICFYANTVINALYEKWGKLNNTTKYPPTLSNDIETIKSELENMKIQISSSLLCNSSTPDAISDILARIHIALEPSAIYKLQKFLVGLELMPENPDKVVLERFKWVNTVRNKMFHMGDIPKYKDMDFNQRAELTCSVTFMLISIARYYFAKEIFKIDNHLITQYKEDICQYFESGIFRGQKVFEEGYAQFFEKQELAWIKNGDYI